MSLSQSIVLFFKSIVVGVSVFIPGLSGGTVAMALRVYEQALVATAELFKSFKKHFTFLIILAIGGVLGIWAASAPLEWLVKTLPNEANLIFSIAALVSLYFFSKQNIKGAFRAHDPLMILIGLGIAYFISYTLSRGGFSADENILLLIPIGLFLACALVLPAISFSFMLKFFNLYERTLEAINGMEIPFLLILGFSVLIGIFLFSKIFLFIVRRAERSTYLVIAGFVVYSALEILLKALHSYWSFIPTF